MDNLEKKNKFLETYNLPKLNQDESENLNKQNTINDTEAVIKKLPTNKSPRLDGFINKFYQTFKELTPILFTLCKKFKRREDFQALFIRPVLS